MAELYEISTNSIILRAELKSIIDKARYEAAVFAILTVILTPFVLAITTIILIFALAFADLPVIDHLGYELSVVTGVNLSLAFMAVSYFLKPKQVNQRSSSDVMWLAVALGFFCALLVISYGTMLAITNPTGFWLVYLLLALAMLGCIGHAYEPHDDYYLGWTAGPLIIGDPFTIQDDIDRAHMFLGFTASLAHFVIASYADIFGSTWLWIGLEEHELSASVELLQALALNDTTQAKLRLRASHNTSALGIVRALVKLEMITISRGSPRLSLKGREFLGLKGW